MKIITITLQVLIILTTMAFVIIVAPPNSAAGAVTGNVSVPGGFANDVYGTTTTFTSSANPSVLSDSVTLTAQVTPAESGHGIPTGAVHFFWKYWTGNYDIATVNLDGSGQTSCNWTASYGTGNYILEADYSGSASFAASSNSINQQVIVIGTTTKFTSSPNPSVLSDNVTLTAQVTPTESGHGPPTGTVLFFWRYTTGNYGIATVNLDAYGKATCNWTTGSTGNYVLEADYSGSTTFAASSDSINQQAVLIATITTLTSSLNPSVPSDNVTLTAQVTPTESGHGPPTGTVLFFWRYTTGNYGIATVNLDASGKATCNWTAGNGNYVLEADYSGSTTFAASSNAINQQVVDPVDLNLTMYLQGGQRTGAGWIVPLTVRLFTPGTDVMAGAPVFTFNLTTAKSGSAAIAQNILVAPGTFDITANSSTTLLNVKRKVVIAAPSTDVSMGTLLEGNANGNNIINILDFGILAGSYGKTSGQTGFDSRADFDRNGIINIYDFGLLASNYGKYSPKEIP